MVSGVRAQVSSGDHGRDPRGGSGSRSTAFARSRALVTRFLEERSSGEAGLWTLQGQGGPRTAREPGGAGRSCSGAGRTKGGWKKALTWGPGLSAGVSRGALGSGAEGVGPRGKGRRLAGWAAGSWCGLWREEGRGLGWVLVGCRVGFFSFSFSFSNSTQTNSNLIEFKFKFEFKTPMHSNKIKPCTSMNATTSLNLEKI